jgi:hypothetical protein
VSQIVGSRSSGLSSGASAYLEFPTMVVFFGEWFFRFVFFIPLFLLHRLIVSFLVRLHNGIAALAQA